MVWDHIVLGLGNPGPKYSFTRHNAGFIVLDILAQELGVKWTPALKGLGAKINADLTEMRVENKNILALKPQTYMNLSGESLQKLFYLFGHLKENTPITVIHDEIDLELGKVRVKFGGGDAGHNGLKSIRSVLGHGDFFRVRMGVSKPPADSKIEVADWVLQNFQDSEHELLYSSTDRCITSLKCLIDNPNENLQKAQTLASRDET